MTRDARLPGALIGPAELRQLLHADAKGLRLLDARSQGREAYIEGHLPGARFADLERDLSSPGEDAALGGRHPLPPIERWCRTLGRWGIGPESAVVVYDDAGGANAAARAWWMLRAVGHRDVAVLDGGLAAGREAGLETTDEAPEAEEASTYPLPEQGSWLLPLVDAGEVDALRSDPDACLLDARAGFRYRGEHDPFDPVSGHIPGALSHPYSENLDQAGRFRSPQELRRRFDTLLGGRGVDRSAVYCGSGVTACHTLLALEHAGLGGASLYVGSWSEWCRGDRPIGTVLRSRPSPRS